MLLSNLQILLKTLDPLLPILYCLKVVIRACFLDGVLGVSWVEGVEMTSVIFIRDYIQLVFEGINDTAILSTFTLPTVYNNDNAYNIDTKGYRDELCSLINQNVEKVLLLEEAIQLIFELGRTIEISLREQDYDSPEAAMFRRGDERVVW
ncbi:hypothetical protein WAK64_17985 [Bacillus spongiae]|uniref:Uncharacterized protein n=1 Tax=Bacillus spongiae TaxID=2683610 RepID=A0ABU8HIC7_9BACI